MTVCPINWLDYTTSMDVNLLDDDPRLDGK